MHHWIAFQNWSKKEVINQTNGDETNGDDMIKEGIMKIYLRNLTDLVLSSFQLNIVMTAKNYYFSRKPAPHEYTCSQLELVIMENPFLLRWLNK